MRVDPDYNYILDLWLAFDHKGTPINNNNNNNNNKQYEETIYHLISGCPTLAKNEYIIRHDKVCTHLHYSI
jgi:hypothetical protein